MNRYRKVFVLVTASYMARIFLIIIYSAPLFLLPPPAHSFCFDEAGRAYGIIPLLLRVISRV